ncbi:MAG TPA: type II toxin-antitoxin system VapB family antitoxin [Devosia sp.]
MNEVKQLNIKNAEAYELAAEIARLEGESMTDAVLRALRREAAFARKLKDKDAYVKRLLSYGDRYAALPKSGLTEDEILGYDENGVPR